MTTNDIFFSIIRSEIHGIESASDIFEKLSFESYGQLYTLSKNHDLAHIMAAYLSRKGMLKDDEISNKFNKQLMIAFYREAQKECTLEQLAVILEDARLTHIMLKGAVIRDLYPQAWMRTSCDIDILIKKEDVDLAIETLCKAGYSRTDDSSTHDYSFMSPNNVHVELHYTLAQEGQLSRVDKMLESVWESYVTLDEGRSYRYSMTPEVFILYHLAHMVRHLVYGGCGIRPIIDFWIIQNNMTFDNDKLKAMLEQTKLTKFYDVVAGLSSVWMDNAQHTEQTKLLEGYILTGGVYGTTGNSAQIEAARGVGKVRSFFNLMFLPKSTLEVIYPNLRKHPYMFPFYQVKRWFRIFNRRKRSKIKHLTATRNNVSQTSVESAKLMLEYLGLSDQ